MINLKPNELEIWRAYGGSGKVEATYAGSREITDDLIERYLSGKKWAGSSLLADFETTGEVLPAIGDHWIVLNSKDKPAFILQVERIESHLFKDVPVEIAIAEGEGDLSLEQWRKSHRWFFTPFLARWGVENLDNAIVLTQFFKLVYRVEG